MRRQRRRAVVEDEGLPLAEAVRAFVDPDLLKELDELDQRIASWSKPEMRQHYRAWPDEDRFHRQYVAIRQGEIRQRQAAAHASVLDDLTRRLLSGELIATGYEKPLRAQSERVEIKSALWGMLRPRLGDSSAKGGDLEVIRILVRRAHPEPATPPEPEIAYTPPATAERRSGPRSLRPQIEAEMRARAERLALRPNVTAEARFLAKWVKENFPNHLRPPQPKTIINSLGAIYHELKAPQDARVRTRAPESLNDNSGD